MDQVKIGKFIADCRKKQGHTQMQLAEKLGRRIFIPPLSLCGDNAAMIAAQGYYEYAAGRTADSSLNASALDSKE